MGERGGLGTITSALSRYVVPIDSVQPHPENARKGRVAAIRDSLERFGQVRPIVVQESTRNILGGSHTWRAARQLGWTEIAALMVDLDDTKAKALMVALNRTADLGEYDDAAVLAMIESLDSLAGIGFTPEDVADLISRVEGGDYDVPGDVMIRKADSGIKMKEIVLTMGHSHHQRFMQQVDKLRADYGTDGMASTVFEAVKREAGS